MNRPVPVFRPMFLFLACSGTVAASTEKPNILLIFIDDMGYPAVSCYGNSHVKTPNIDRIAQEGVLFTQGYVCPQSTPSRASLLTGQYTARNKMWHVIPGYTFPYTRLNEPAYLEELPREQFTLAEALKTAGYATACLGKWHLSTYDNDGYYTYLYPEKAMYYGFDYVNPRQTPPEYQSYGDKGVNMLTMEAMRFMEDNKDRPFFIYLSHHTLHNPILAPQELVKKYSDKGYPETGLFSATYLASIEHLDQSVGVLLKKMEELGIDDNTMILFISDNGGVDNQFDNAPLRYGKGSAYEGGIRVPFMMRWPQKMKGNQICNQPVHIVDVYPTLQELAGIANLQNQVLDGESLLPLITGKKKQQGKFEKRAVFFYQPLYDIQWGAVPSAAVVKGDYKLIWFFGDYIDLDNDSKYIPEGRVELYNLKQDIGETKNIANSNAPLVHELKKLLEDWMHATGVEVPAVNPSFSPEKWKERKDGKMEE